MDKINIHVLSTQWLNAISPHLYIPAMYWLLQLQKQPFKFRLYHFNSKCSTIKLFRFLDCKFTTVMACLPFSYHPPR